jgi:hypothetical protein
VPGPLARAGRAPEAEQAYRDAVAADATFAPAHLGLAELLERRGDRQGARKELVEALAYHPASARGMQLLRRLMGGATAAPGPTDGGWYDTPKQEEQTAESRRGALFPIFLDVDGQGAIHVATNRSEAAEIYGGCRAVMRFEQPLRGELLRQPPETPYYLSVTEEVVCLEAALGAYIASNRGKRDKSDPELEQLLSIARGDGLSGYVMFEILGQHRPERARTAPPEVHRDTVAYVERWVLSHHEPVTERGYTAKR